MRLLVYPPWSFPEPSPFMSEAKELLLQKLPEVERVIVSICRRNGMDTDETEEFAAEVKLRLVANDYHIVRQFKGRSSFETYIAAVVKRLLLDYRNHQWGKWHDAAEAERLGPLAVDLARLVHRDGRTIDDALTILAPKYPGVIKRDLEELLPRLPARPRRRNVDVSEASTLPAPAVADPALGQTATRISEAVNGFIDDLPDEDQLVLRLRFEQGFTVAQIARSMNRDQQVLYRRLYAHFDSLRDVLKRAGIAAEDVEDLIGTNTSQLSFHLKNKPLRPSEGNESVGAARQEEISS